MRSSPVKVRLNVEQLETRNMPCATGLGAGLGGYIPAPPLDAGFASTCTGPSYTFTGCTNGYKVVPSQADCGHSRSGSPAPNPTLQQGRSGSKDSVCSDSQRRSGCQGRSGARVRSGHQSRSGCHADSGGQPTVTPPVVATPLVTPPVVITPPVAPPVVTTPPVTAPVVTTPPVTAPVAPVMPVGLS
jgi:hypothetical protein